MDRLATLELDAFPRRVTLMAVAAFAVLLVDVITKTVVVELDPNGLVFHVSGREPFGLGASLILVAAAGSVLACVLPVSAVAVAAGLALGGALGNLASRHLWSGFGGSPDFIRFADGSKGNLADLAIAAGVSGMLIGTVVWLVWKTFGTGRNGGGAESGGQSSSSSPS